MAQDNNNSQHSAKLLVMGSSEFGKPQFNIGDKVLFRDSVFEIYADKGEYGYNISGAAGTICGVDGHLLKPYCP